jgi:hypothetical protein
MQPNDPDQPTIEIRYRTLFILWFAMCMSVLMFLVLVQFTPAPIEGDLRLSLILNSIGIVPVGISFLLKQRILQLAADRQRIDLVQTGYVLAFALCEVASLLGMIDHFANGSRYYYVGFIFAGAGLLLHFPRKQHLLDASQQRF